MSVLSLLPQDKKKEGRKDSIESVYSSNSRLNLLNKRKRLVTDMSNPSLISKGDRYVTQRVLSAKTHRVKQLQNQLADAHYHLQELSNENRVLRAVQKKQEIALQRYENSNAELPQVLSSHSEEMRCQQTKFKQMKTQYKEVMQKLKERDVQFQVLKDEHDHLLELSKDRHLLEREKLQHQVAELTAKVQQQNEIISTLQRRIALEAKNFKHQIMQEINKHKDTRHDLDLAINNADKLSTIIEMKEKMLCNASSRYIKSPTKMSSNNVSRTLNRTTKSQDRMHDKNEDHSVISKFCENSRSLSSALSHDEEVSSSIEPRSRYARSRTNSTSTRSTPDQTRKSSKGSDEIIELAKTVQDGMADLAIFDDKDSLRNASPDDVQNKLDAMKVELLKKIKNNEEPGTRKSSALKKRSTEESIEKQIDEIDDKERPKSRGRRGSSVSFYPDVTIEETTTSIAINDYKSSTNIEHAKPKRENSKIERSGSGKPVEKYCKDIMQDIEKTNKVIDKHMAQFSSSKFDNDKIVQQLQAVDKINEYMNSNVEIPEATLTELNNNFKILTDHVIGDTIPIPKKRSLTDRRSSKLDSGRILEDDKFSNQDLLDDLLGKK